MAPRCRSHPRAVNQKKRASYPHLEIIANLAVALEVEPAELLRIPLVKARSSGDTR